jgi:hypothetical protein
LVVASVVAALWLIAYEIASGALANASGARIAAVVTSVALLAGALVRASRIGRHTGRDSSLPPPRPPVTVDEAEPGPLTANHLGS